MVIGDRDLAQKITDDRDRDLAHKKNDRPNLCTIIGKVVKTS